MGLGFVLLVLVGVAVLVLVGRKLILGSGAANAWAPAIEGAAKTLGGRPALTSGTAELRAESEGVTVTVRVQGDNASADAPLYPGAPALRLYLASGVDKPAEDLRHIPEVPLPPAFSLEPPVILRSDQNDLGARLADECALDLANVRRDAKATAVELLVRGGTLRLTLPGARPSPDFVESLVRTTSRLVGRVGGNRLLAEKVTKQIPSVAPTVDRCRLCGGEKRAGVAWVRCKRCQSPHHAECWDTAKRCANESCGSVEAEPMA